MDFKNMIEKLENEKLDGTYIFRLGSVPVMITAVHTMNQRRVDGTYKLREPFTKGIARYVAEMVDASCFIKIKDTKVDSNGFEFDDFKFRLVEHIKEHDIKLVIDLHGAGRNRDFDVEFGTLDNTTINSLVVKKLENCFIVNGIQRIKYNDPFKGGGVTRTVFEKTGIAVIQIEINRNFRDLDKSSEMEKICKSLIMFIDDNYK